jgi:hypothetical protein
MLSYMCKLPEERLQEVLVLAEQVSAGQGLLNRLVNEGLVTADWARKAEQYVRGKIRSRGGDAKNVSELDRSFGQLALQRGHIRVSDLEEALLEQERLKRRNLSFRIGEILMRSGAMKLAQIRQILREQGCENEHCTACGAIIGALEPAAGQACPNCGGRLELAIFLDVVKGDLERRSPDIPAAVG